MVKLREDHLNLFNKLRFEFYGTFPESYKVLVNKYNLSDCGGAERLGILHRLDKDTSGLIIVAKNNVTTKTGILQESQLNDMINTLING